MQIVTGLACLGLLAGCAKAPVNRTSSEPLAVVASVDLDRYLGRWYEIARLDHSFEKGCEGVTADYSMREDGLIRVVNTCRKGSPAGEARAAKGRARVVDQTTNAKLEVSFFGPFWGDYWIIDLTDDYSRAIVGEPSGRYLWILSRTPMISEESRADAIAQIKAAGYDASALYFPKQPPETEAPASE